MSKAAAVRPGRRPGPSRTIRGAAALFVAGALAIGACSSDGDDGAGGGDGGSSASSSGASDSASPSETALEPYVTVPAGVTLTDPGTRLYLGQRATVAWQPTKKVTAVLDLRVRSVERTTFAKSFEGWKIDKATSRLKPFFVRARAVNPVKRNLGGIDVLLWARDDEGTLVDAQRFREQVFKPCPGGTLPKTFRKGASANLCFVYLLSPGRRFDAVVFPPPNDRDPVVWKGQSPAKKAEANQKKNQKNKNQ
ncbi:hypothetical protein [Nocardioides sp. YIM 152588]|uniref:hypothetical protein n=1 Tax=Nocardioides sp. YIM 152588 TaxID=3158259 RepID=UPI0032E4180B